ncbi:hypothetical protein [Avrilella dinanensis]|nr:hypothetical protein [Avrilella dinanensis]
METLVSSLRTEKTKSNNAQRKGGTPDPKSLQFKLNPLDLFESIPEKE